MNLYFTMVRVQDEPVMGGHVLAETPAEARAWLEHEFFYRPTDKLPADMEALILKHRHAARVFGFNVKATKSTADHSNALNR